MAVFDGLDPVLANAPLNGQHANNLELTEGRQPEIPCDKIHELFGLEFVTGHDFHSHPVCTRMNDLRDRRLQPQTLSDSRLFEKDEA